LRVFGQRVHHCRLVAAQQLELVDGTLVPLAVREAEA